MDTQKMNGCFEYIQSVMKSLPTFLFFESLTLNLLISNQ